MPTKKEIAREVLNRWEPWGKIVEKAGDGSGTYEELRIFLEGTAAQTYEELRKKNKQLVELKSEIKEKKTKLTNTNNELSTLSQNVEEKKSEQNKLLNENQTLRERNQELRETENELVKKGFDDEVIKEFRESDINDKPELTQRIMSLKRYTELLDEIEEQQNALNTIKREISKNTDTDKNLQDKISGLNQEIQRLEEVFERLGKIGEIAELAVNYGYSPSDFESLMKTIEGYFDLTPYTTNKKVFEALQEYQSLQQIKEATINASKENETIRLQLQKTKAELNSIRDTVMGTILETKDETLKLIQAQVQEAEANIKNLHILQGKLVSDSEERLRRFWGNLEEKNKALEDKLREIGKYEELLKYAMTIATAQFNPEYAKNIKIHDIYSLSKIVDHWVHYNLPTVTASPPREVSTMRGFNALIYSVEGLSRFLSSELYRRISQ